jgi:hypothetical protein
MYDHYDHYCVTCHVVLLGCEKKNRSLSLHPLSIIHHWHLMTEHDSLTFFDAHIHDLEQLNQDGSDPGMSTQLLVLKKKRSAMTPLGALPDKIIIHICHSCNLPATPRPPPKLLHQTCQLPRYLYNSSQPLAINPGN